MKSLAGPLLAGAASMLLVALAACGGGHTTTILVPLEAGPPVQQQPGVDTRLPDGGVNCATTGDQDTCGNCCRDQNSASSDKYGALVIKCFCQSADFCKTQCADSLCGNTNPAVTTGSPCDQCITAKNADCAQTVNPECLNDPSCAPILQCFSDADCQDKPTL